MDGHSRTNDVIAKFFDVHNLVNPVNPVKKNTEQQGGEYIG